MGLILWIIFGALVGWIASMLMGTSEGLVKNIILGIAGALVGGLLMNFLGQEGIGSFTLYSVAVAVVGACALVAVVRAVQRS
jgi:uncharacterized membrane protein YeaQ/YmgE (transglycosylase-associated protein family)